MARPARPRRARLPGVDIKPGSVKQARVDAGLSLGGIAGEELSRNAIHQIELGRTRPTLPTLRLIARRTGKPLSFFLEGPPPDAAAGLRPRLRQLERALEQHRYQDAVALGSELLDSVEADPSVQARVEVALGRALVGVGEAYRALPHLTSAAESARRIGDQWLLVDALDWLSGAQFLIDDQASLETAEAALDLCLQLDPCPPSTHARILTHIASIRLSRHESERAIDAYRAALDLSASLRDLSRLARTYDGLGAAYQELGDFAQAEHYAEKALALYEAANEQALAAGTENNLGMLLLRAGRLDEAEQHLRASLAACRTLNLQAGRSHVLLSLAELHVKRGEMEPAGELAREAADLSDRLGERFNWAKAQQLLGRLAAETGRAAAVDRAFKAALEVLEAAAAPERVAECHAEYAMALERVGRSRQALDHWKRAVLARRPNLEADGTALDPGAQFASPSAPA